MKFKKKNLFPTSWVLYIFLGFLCLNLSCYQKCFKERERIIHSLFLLCKQSSIPRATNLSVMILCLPVWILTLNPSWRFRDFCSWAQVPCFSVYVEVLSNFKCACGNGVLKSWKVLSAFFPTIYIHMHACILYTVCICQDRFFFLSNSSWKETLVVFHVKGIQKYLFVHLKSAKEVEQRIGRAKRSFTVCNKGSWQRALKWNAYPREMLLMEGFCKLLSDSATLKTNPYHAKNGMSRSVI